MTGWTVASLARHPVKSVGGESLPALDVDHRGVVGDRAWAVYTDDGGIASGKNSRRFRKVDGLLQWASVLTSDGPRLVSPTGESFDLASASDAVSHAFGRTLAIRAETTVPHFDDSALHVVTTSSLAHAATAAGGDVDARRFRANVVVDTGPDACWVEDAWLGRELAVGPEVVLRVDAAMSRCVMVDLAHRAVPAGARVLKPLGAAHDATLGVQLSVVTPGRIAVGDAVRLR